MLNYPFFYYGIIETFIDKW